MIRNRFVVDTNTLISAALLPQSIARQSVDKALAVGNLLVSEATLLEVMQVTIHPFVVAQKR